MVLKQILRVAKRRHYLREDPTSDIRDLKEPPTEVDPLDPQEIGMFLAHCPTWWQPYFSLAFWTGARPNELAALKWGNVDWTSSTFRIRAGRYRGSIEIFSNARGNAVAFVRLSGEAES